LLTTITAVYIEVEVTLTSICLKLWPSDVIFRYIQWL